MTKLPSANAIPVLTDDLLIASVEAHTKKLASSMVDDQQSVRFICAAFRLKTQVAAQKTRQLELAMESVSDLINRLPHVRLSFGYARPPLAEISEWCSDNNSPFFHVTDKKGHVFVFQTDEEAVLFRLRWA